MTNIKCTPINFIRSDHMLPAKSGYYLVHTSAGGFTTLQYSKKHNMWNCNDNDEEHSFAFEHDDPYIVAWADTKLACDQLASWRNGR